MDYKTTQSDIEPDDLEQAKILMASLAQIMIEDGTDQEDEATREEHTLVFLVPAFVVRIPGPLHGSDKEVDQDTSALLSQIQRRMKKQKNAKPALSHMYIGAISVDVEAGNSSAISPMSVSVWRGSLSPELDNANGVTAQGLADDLMAGKAYDSVLSSEMRKDVADLLANMGMANHDISLLIGVGPRQVRRYREDKRKELAAAYKREGVHGAIGRLCSVYEASYRVISESMSSLSLGGIQKAKMAKMRVDMTIAFTNAINSLLAK